METDVRSQIAATQALMGAMLADAELLGATVAAAQACIDCLRAGNKILLAGNGGSAADAQHIAAELVGRFKVERAGLAAIALTTDTSILTAVGNDYGFDRLFARQVEALGRPADVLIAYSTSGRSANILRGLEAARSGGLVTVGLTGNRGEPMVEFCDYLLAVPSGETPKIQEGHLVLGHVLCGLIEHAFTTGIELRQGR
ncbi:D-sedoheptulose 7-phosphate isomerase [Allochromatium warmingii]|uniref:Phosphoheptose isomerase n=1 Tax=Allochromatium warmingii TaxID=61595 RepID=A0A1H3E1B7_ALLWA|nr:D-sedoheptulose 7-phosphate isomerase [Allochromatium warmingii]SDX72471.1 D-sedoheptulose 7-phosphate isomerase [Allochromatium warmingii]